MELRTCSHARPAANMAKELANTFLPVVAIPAAIDIILPSAIPILKNRSGYLSLKLADIVQQAKSASSTTTFSLLPYSANASP